MKTYQNPLEVRYASEEMLYNFSPKMKFSTWRKLWYSLARIQKELGLKITQEQLDEIKKNIYNIDYSLANQYEKKFRHDVMAHVHTLGEIAPKARSIIHLGATSAFVDDNTDLIQIKKGLIILKKKIISIIQLLRNFSLSYKDLPTLGFTHYQPAQLTTVGKRATLWLQSLSFDFKELDFKIKNLKFRGVKGTTGTAASFKELFNGDYEKIKILDKELAKSFGFEKTFGVTGQTYDRKIDVQILSLLSNMSQTAHKFTTDLRLLSNMKEIDEPFDNKDQIGSSAMAYKRNPILSERISSLAKFVMSVSQSTVMTAANQWFERTLDDSANKRLSIPQAFLAVDSIFLIWKNIMNGIIVYPKQINKHIIEELPFMATEYIIVEAVKNGADRQKIHELIRVHSIEASKQVKELGSSNDLIERIINDEKIPINKNKLLTMLNPRNFIGFSVEQTEEFIENEIDPILKDNKNLLEVTISSIDLKI